VVTRRWVFAFPLAAAISWLAGCSGGSTANVQNPPPPPTSTVAIAFQPTPPATILLNASTPLTAVVTNDSSSAGVDWSLSCSIPGTAPNKCGTLSALHTASAAATTYTPPTNFSGNSVAVDIVAFASADHSQNVSAPVTVTGFGSALQGTYVLQAQGVDATSFGPYQFAGVVVFDGNGAVTSGEQTVNLFDPNLGVLASKTDPITGGSYFVGPDGQGTITINTADQNIGVSGVETFSFVSLSASQALIAEVDFSETASGTMDLQASKGAPSGGYAFVVKGVDTFAEPMAMGGVFNIDSANTISGTGSVIDQNLAGTLTVKQGLSGTVSAPDAFGAVMINLNVPTFPTFAALQFTGYIVDATHIAIIESDNPDGAGAGSTGGVAIGQGSATGTFLTNSAFSGTYVFGVSGVDLASTAPTTLTSVGLFSANGSGVLANGHTDTFLQTNGSQGTAGSQIRASFKGTYTIDNKGTGRVRVAMNGFKPAPQPAYVPTFFFYLTGNGNPPLVLDGGDSTFDYPSVGTGIAYAQASGTLTFNGKYGISITQQNGFLESDGTAEITADSTAGTLSGLIDIDAGLNAQFASPVAGTFTSASGGRFKGTLDSVVFDSTPFAVEYYMVDSGHGFFVETDAVDPNFPAGIVSFGYYAARTPVCAGCP